MRRMPRMIERPAGSPLPVAAARTTPADLQPKVAAPRAVDPATASAEATGLEQRRAARKTLLVPGLIGLRGYRLTVPCKVLDMSATGAQSVLVVSPSRIRKAQDLPDDVILVFVHDGVETDCVIRWRRGDRFGLRFLSAMRKSERARP